MCLASEFYIYIYSYIYIYIVIYIYIYIYILTLTNTCIETPTSCGGMLWGKFVMQNGLKADRGGLVRRAPARGGMGMSHSMVSFDRSNVRRCCLMPQQFCRLAFPGDRSIMDVTCCSCIVRIVYSAARATMNGSSVLVIRLGMIELCVYAWRDKAQTTFCCVHIRHRPSQII